MTEPQTILVFILSFLSSIISLQQQNSCFEQVAALCDVYYIMIIYIVSTGVEFVTRGYIKLFPIPKQIWLFSCGSGTGTECVHSRSVHSVICDINKNMVGALSTTAAEVNRLPRSDIIQVTYDCPVFSPGFSFQLRLAS